jgi:hypothetical protein
VNSLEDPLTTAKYDAQIAMRIVEGAAVVLLGRGPDSLDLRPTDLKTSTQQHFGIAHPLISSLMRSDSIVSRG